MTSYYQKVIWSTVIAISTFLHSVSSCLPFFFKHPPSPEATLLFNLHSFNCSTLFYVILSLPLDTAPSGLFYRIKDLLRLPNEFYDYNTSDEFLLPRKFQLVGSRPSVLFELRIPDLPERLRKRIIEWLQVASLPQFQLPVQIFDRNGSLTTVLSGVLLCSTIFKSEVARCRRWLPVGCRSQPKIIVRIYVLTWITAVGYSTS